ncbi:MAG TPA: sigma-70 family RNA polymerase sigma factor [Symbiobacteriaceae bacterium]|nr:sigma-70 family RNA polymerase sigma factor [Symbiobacteriaceae bacterium]
MTTAATHGAIEAVWRIESARLIAGLARMVRDIGLAEDLAHDAVVAALERWPESGVPEKPGAWLMATAKRRAIDLLRRKQMADRKHEDLGREAPFAIDDYAAVDVEVGDNLLRLIFIACHPVLSREARVALTLRLLGGLTTDAIARAFLVPEPTVAQRIVRAKRTLAAARVPFEVPGAPERGARLASVLEVIYLVFNEGYATSAGEDWIRPALCNEALRLGRILTELAPQESEVHGLVVGSAPDPAWPCGAGTSREAGGRPGAVRPPGCGGRLSCAGPGARGDQLGAHRGAVRCAGSGGTVASGGAEPGRCRVDGVRVRGGA